MAVDVFIGEALLLEIVDLGLAHAIAPVVVTGFGTISHVTDVVIA